MKIISKEEYDCMGIEEEEILTEEEKEILERFESFEDFVPNKVNRKVYGFFAKRGQDNTNKILTNTLGVSSDVVCGAINLTEGLTCETIDIAAGLAKRGTGVCASLARSTVKTFTLGYSKNRQHLRDYTED